jgi:hypothetical protein
MLGSFGCGASGWPTAPFSAREHLKMPYGGTCTTSMYRYPSESVFRRKANLESCTAIKSQLAARSRSRREWIVVDKSTTSAHPSSSLPPQIKRSATGIRYTSERPCKPCHATFYLEGRVYLRTVPSYSVPTCAERINKLNSHVNRPTPK